MKFYSYICLIKDAPAMCTIEGFKGELIKLGFNKYKETYMLAITDNIFLHIDYLDLHAVFTPYILCTGDPVCCLSDIIPVSLPFDIAAYMVKVKKEVAENYANCGKMVYINQAIDNWNKVYATGYTFDNFKAGIQQNIDVSYQFNFDGVNPTLMRNYTHNDTIEVHYIGKLVGKFLPYKILNCYNNYDILHRHAYGFAEVKSHIRKTIIDELLEIL